MSAHRRPSDAFMTTDSYESIVDALADAETATIALTDVIRNADGLFVDPAQIELLAYRARRLVTQSLRAAREADV